MENVALKDLKRWVDEGLDTNNISEMPGIMGANELIAQFFMTFLSRFHQALAAIPDEYVPSERLFGEISRISHELGDRAAEIANSPGYGQNKYDS